MTLRRNWFKITSENDLVNRAAMGRARFMVYPWFFFNRAAMGRARFMVYPWFFFNRAAMGRARFMFYPWFIFFYFFFVGDQT